MNIFYNSNNLIFMKSESGISSFIGGKCFEAFDRNEEIKSSKDVFFVVFFNPFLNILTIPGESLNSSCDVISRY